MKNRSQIFQDYRIFFLLMITILIAGCATPEQDVARAAAICTEAGYEPTGPIYEQCLAKNVADIQERRKEVGQAFAVGLQTYGASTQQTYQRYTPQPPRQPIRCTSTQSYNTTYTNCY